MNAHWVGACVVLSLLGGEAPTDEQNEIRRLQGVVLKLYEEKAALRREMKSVRKELEAVQKDNERLEEYWFAAQRAVRKSERALQSAKQESQRMQEELASLETKLQDAKNTPLSEDASRLFESFVFEFQLLIQKAPGIEPEVSERVVVLLDDAMVDWSRNSEKRTTFCRAAKRKIAPTVRAYNERVAHQLAVIDAEVAAAPEALDTVLECLNDEQAARCKARYVGTNVRWKGTITRRAGILNDGDWVLSCGNFDVFVSMSAGSDTPKVGQTVIVKGEIAKISRILRLEVHLTGCVLE